MRVQHLSQFADVALADGGLGNCEADHRGKVAAEEPADESVHSCGHDVLSADEGAVPELTTLSSMRENALALQPMEHGADSCLLYTSDAADERSSVDLGGRRIIKKQIEPDSINTTLQSNSSMHISRIPTQT